ncbi:PREDICTED: spastin-like [Branchiostoma belcheri]|uniref:Spastin-like n=1 Tax=Branchiostoma belcheri TaxID=7741 RepID=A0A6P5ACY5_BRABE|nr:PREDICTED: spastin-like [Branchiostoma belcheri]
MRPRKGSASKSFTGTPKKRPKPPEKKQSPHRRNLHIAAYPLIVLFNLVSHLVFQIWLFFTFVYRQVLKRRARNTKKQADSSKESSDNMSGETGDPALTRQRAYQKKAFEFISRALKIDEENSGQKQQAIDLYKKGIAELEKGIAVECRGHGEEYDRARKLREKMLTNLGMARDRLDLLETVLASCSDDTSDQCDRDKPSKSTRVTGVNAPVSKKVPMANKSSTLPRASRVHSYGGGGSSKSHSPQPLRKKVSPVNDDTSDQCDRDKPSKSTRVPPLPPSQQGAQLRRGWQQQKSQPPSPLRKKSLQSTANRENRAPGKTTAPGRGSPRVTAPSKKKLASLKNVDSKLANIILDQVIDSRIKNTWDKMSAVGEGEKLVKALFSVARELQPSIIFMDEIDSLLCERREGEHDASRRLKTEFLLEFDGVHSGNDDRILVMGATNRPQELDDAVLRRFAKRVYVQLPELETRVVIMSRLLKKHNNPLNQKELQNLARQTEGYSGSDLTNLAKDAALGPIRELDPAQVKSMPADKIRNIRYSDFVDSLKRIRRSVPQNSLSSFEQWNRDYGDMST